MARRLKITRQEVTEVDYQYLGAFRLRVEVSDPSNSGADPNVFVYNLHPLNPYDQTQYAEFFAIAAPGDLAEYPVGAPRPGTAYPFFRLDYVELDFRATSLAENAWLLIIEEVDALMRALDRMDQLTTTQELWVGAPPDAGDSESQSTSVSSSQSQSTSQA